MFAGVAYLLVIDSFFNQTIFFIIRWFDVECPERSGGNLEWFNENDVTSLNEFL